ncbi:MAG: hypothetical protein WC694_03180 [Candidatus Paceibacterota bacterium]|jgi:hypothetical protein
MKKNYFKIALNAIIISFVGVYVIDYFSHLLFSNPMETLPYFIVKFSLYFLFSILFLSFIDVNRKEFIKVSVAGILVASIFGFYYNILPFIMNKVFNVYFYPFGISLNKLTFLGMDLFGTGVAFGIIHTLAFVGGYYSTKLIPYFSKSPESL